LVNIVRPCNVVDDEQYVEALEFVNSPDLITKEKKMEIQYKPRGSDDDEEEEYSSSSKTKFIWVNYRTLNAFNITNKLQFTKIGNSNWTDCFIFGSKQFKSGVHYFEIKIDYTASGAGIYMGVTANRDTSYYSSDIVMGCSGSNYNCSGGNCYVANSNDRIGIKLDFKNLTVSFYKNDISTNIIGYMKKDFSYTPVVHCFYQNDKFTLSFPKVPK
jgi:hypothetical protein